MCIVELIFVILTQHHSLQLIPNLELILIAVPHKNNNGLNIFFKVSTMQQTRKI